MDSYRYPDDAELTYMVKTFGCQAALGLEYGAPIGPNFREHLAGNQVSAALNSYPHRILLVAKVGQCVCIVRYAWHVSHKCSTMSGQLLHKS